MVKKCPRRMIGRNRKFVLKRFPRRNFQKNVVGGTAGVYVQPVIVYVAQITEPVPKSYAYGVAGVSFQHWSGYLPIEGQRIRRTAGHFERALARIQRGIQQPALAAKAAAQV